MLFERTITISPFKKWLIENKENRRLLIFSLISMTASFTWLKIVYPFPNFMPPDSISYIEAARNNEFINMWPIGYSKFLQFANIFSKSDTFLVTLQFFLLQFAMLYLAFTIRYLLSPGAWISRILFALSFLNPLLLHISNFVSSDCLFITLSVIWFTQLLWILYQPTMRLILFHGIILLLAFTVRYNAMYYPLISISIICVANFPTRKKLYGIGFAIILLSFFIGRTQYEYNKKTTAAQFSPFEGWQLAANALYGYSKGTQYPVSEVPLLFRGIHEAVNQHMTSLRKKALRPDSDVGIYYLWDHRSPLWIYFNKTYKNDTSSLFLKWAKMAPLYNEYGRFLITKNPGAYVRYFVWPNLRKYYVAPPSFMVIYNLGMNTVDRKVATWFGWKNNKVFTRSKTEIIQVVELSIIPITILNVLFLLNSFAFCLAGGYKRSGGYAKKVVILVLTIWLSNILFSIVAAPNELRYQLFPLAITLCFLPLFMGWLITNAFTNPALANVPTKNNSPSKPFQSFKIQ